MTPSSASVAWASKVIFTGSLSMEGGRFAHLLGCPVQPRQRMEKTNVFCISPDSTPPCPCLSFPYLFQRNRYHTLLHPPLHTALAHLQYAAGEPSAVVFTDLRDIPRNSTIASSDRFYFTAPVSRRAHSITSTSSSIIVRPSSFDLVSVGHHACRYRGAVSGAVL